MFSFYAGLIGIAQTAMAIDHEKHERARQARIAAGDITWVDPEYDEKQGIHSTAQQKDLTLLSTKERIALAKKRLRA